MIEQHDLRTSQGRLAFAMQAAGIETSVELAERSGLKEPRVRHYVNGTRQITPGAAKALARALRCSASWLLIGEGDPPKQSAGSPYPAARSREGDELDENLITSILRELRNQFPRPELWGTVSADNLGAIITAIYNFLNSTRKTQQNEGLKSSAKPVFNELLPMIARLLKDQGSGTSGLRHSEDEADRSVKGSLPR